MNGSPELLESFAGPLARLQQQVGAQVQLGVTPPSALLGRLPDPCGFLYGGQDCSEHESGAYTGETSAALLRALGCDLVLVGHSERRQMFGDTDQRVAAKAQRALEAGLTPVVCVGETWAQRQAGETWQVLQQQLAPLSETLAEALDECIFAYEPVWAIGTGKTASPEQAQEVHLWLREKLGNTDTALLYGGSVKPENADDLFAQPDIDGGLIGGASLNWDSFEAICRAAARQKQ